MPVSIKSDQAEKLIETHQLTFADIIELGMPFTDPIADGPTIQTANTVC